MPKTLLNLIPSTALMMGLLISGCDTQSNKAKNRWRTTPMSEATQCALSKEPLLEQTATRQFAGELIYFRSEAQAAAFDEMPGDAKRVIAGRQLLYRSGVMNEFCPLSQEPLPLDARVVRYRKVLIGFLDQKHLDQFNALPDDVTVRICARYLLEADGISNNRCPITDELLLPGAPELEDERYRIAFSNQAALEKFNALADGRRNEITASIILPDRGVANVICPITDRPIRMDSPVVNVDGRNIALRNVDAARTFNKLPWETQLGYAYPENND